MQLIDLALKLILVSFLTYPVQCSSVFLHLYLFFCSFSPLLLRFFLFVLVILLFDTGRISIYSTGCTEPESVDQPGFHIIYILQLTLFPFYKFLLYKCPALLRFSFFVLYCNAKYWSPGPGLPQGLENPHIRFSLIKNTS